MVDATVARFGTVDILVNNAGGSDGFAPVHLMTDEAWDNAAALGINTTFWATRRALASMVEHGWGRIINISSVEGKVRQQAGHQPLRDQQARHQRLHQSRRQRVRHPGHHEQRDPARRHRDRHDEGGRARRGRGRGITYEQFLDVFAQEAMIKRLNTVEEVAAVALLLVSTAGAGITGSLINVDGGTSPY